MYTIDNNDFELKLDYALECVRETPTQYCDMHPTRFRYKLCEYLAAIYTLTIFETDFTDNDIKKYSNEYQENYGKWKHAGKSHNKLGEAIAMYHKHKCINFILSDAPDFRFEVGDNRILGDIGQVSSSTLIFRMGLFNQKRGHTIMFVPNKDFFYMWEMTAIIPKKYKSHTNSFIYD